MKNNPSKIVKEYKAELAGNQLLSRYRRLDRLVDEDGDCYIESPNKIIIKESEEDTIYVVDPGMVNRIDLISYKFYKTPFLWWAIAKVNHIDNPFYIEAGVILRIPPLKNIPV